MPRGRQAEKLDAQNIVDTFGLSALTCRSGAMIWASWSHAGEGSGECELPQGPWNFSTVTMGNLAIISIAFWLISPDELELWKKEGIVSQLNFGPLGT